MRRSWCLQKNGRGLSYNTHPGPPMGLSQAPPSYSGHQWTFPAVRRCSAQILNSASIICRLNRYSSFVVAAAAAALKAGRAECVESHTIVWVSSAYLPVPQGCILVFFFFFSLVEDTGETQNSCWWWRQQQQRFAYE